MLKKIRMYSMHFMLKASSRLTMKYGWALRIALHHLHGVLSPALRLLLIPIGHPESRIIEQHLAGYWEAVLSAPGLMYIIAIMGRIAPL
jgi:hypothetical protein